MQQTSMILKILLPHGVLVETDDVCRVVAETPRGSCGFLPQRLDCVAALVPGILCYQTTGKEPRYVAVDEGILVKTGMSVLVSVCDAIEGDNLELLRDAVRKEFVGKHSSEVELRKQMAVLEGYFVKNMEKFCKM